MNLLRIFYGLMVVISALTIVNNIGNLLVLNSLVAVLGIVGGILFFIKKYQHYYLVLLWIIIQVPYIGLDDMIFDMSLLLNFHLTLGFGSLSLGLNFQALFLLLVPYIILTKFLNREIEAKPFTEMTKADFGEKLVFQLTSISESKKLVADVDIEVNGEHYSKLYFTPIKDERFNKATVSLVQGITKKMIKGTFSYEFV